LIRDRFLLAILIAITALAGLALALFFLRQGRQDYASEDTPQGILRNYVLALEKRDFERAYGYLKEAKGKPDLVRFREDFLLRRIDLSGSAIQIGETQPSGEDVLISVVVIRSGGGPFSDVYREPNTAVMVKDEAGNWKISSMPYPYWGWDWYNPEVIKPVPAPPGD